MEVRTLARETLGDLCGWRRMGRRYWWVWLAGEGDVPNRIIQEYTPGAKVIWDKKFMFLILTKG